MKHIKTLDQFVNENLNEATFDITYTVTNKINYNGPMFQSQADDAGETAHDIAQMMAYDVGLVKGSLTWDDDELTISGSNKDGQTIYINQKGEYNMYGGPYTPKMGKPTAKLAGKNVLPAVKKAFKSYGGWEEGEDLGRTDIYGYVFNK